MEKKGQIWVGEILGEIDEELGRREKRLGIRMKEWYGKNWRLNFYHKINIIYYNYCFFNYLSTFFFNDAHMLQITGFYDFCSLTFPMAYIPTLVTALTSDALPNVFAPVLPISGDVALGETKNTCLSRSKATCCSYAWPPDGKASIFVEFPGHLHIPIYPRESGALFNNRSFTT